MSAAIQVRPTQPEDRPRILGMVWDAFATEGRDGHEEVEIVEAIWARGAGGENLDLVATLDDALAGHVLGSWGDLAGHQVIGIAPLSVSPPHQGIGVGRALMQEAIQRADSAGLPLMVLLGDPAYYGRFGFEPAGPLNIVYRPVGPDSPYFQVRRLSAYASLQGEYIYAWEA